MNSTAFRERKDSKSTSNSKANHKANNKLLLRTAGTIARYATKVRSRRSLKVKKETVLKPREVLQSVCSVLVVLAACGLLLLLDTYDSASVSSCSSDCDVIGASILARSGSALDAVVASGVCCATLHPVTPTAAVTGVINSYNFTSNVTHQFNFSLASLCTEAKDGEVKKQNCSINTRLPWYVLLAPTIRLANKGVIFKNGPSKQSGRYHLYILARGQRLGLPGRRHRLPGLSRELLRLATSGRTTCHIRDHQPMSYNIKGTELVFSNSLASTISLVDALSSLHSSQSVQFWRDYIKLSRLTQFSNISNTERLKSAVGELINMYASDTYEDTCDCDVSEQHVELQTSSVVAADKGGNLAALHLSSRVRATSVMLVAKQTSRTCLLSSVTDARTSVNHRLAQMLLSMLSGGDSVASLRSGPTLYPGQCQPTTTDHAPVANTQTADDSITQSTSGHDALCTSTLYYTGEVDDELLQSLRKEFRLVKTSESRGEHVSIVCS